MFEHLYRPVEQAFRVLSGQVRDVPHVRVQECDDLTKYTYLAALAISSASASSIALMIRSIFSRSMASSLVSNMAWSNCMISAGLAPCLFPIAVFLVWRLKIVPGTVHVPSHQGRNPKMRKNSGVITLVVKYSNIRLSKELDCILIMFKSGHFSDVVLIQSQKAWECLCLRLLHRLPFCLQKVCHRPIAAESSVFFLFGSADVR